MRSAAIYCLDQDSSLTSSIGIFNFTKRYIHALARQPDPGIEIALWLSSANAEELSPPSAPPWMRIRRVEGLFANGGRRLWADHVLAPRLAASEGVGLVHFPKGWIPVCPPRRARTVATLHDTIIQYYRTQFPSFFSPLKTAYFDRAARRALRKAHRILTDSNFSRAELLKLAPEAAGKISVVCPGPFLDVSEEESDKPSRRGVLVLGSRMPHKATAETLRLLDGYAKRRHASLTVTVTGIAEWPAEWGAAPSGVKLELVGRVSNADLPTLMRSRRALVLLSKIEGFGMPLLEAYSVGTPACYRAVGALAEIMNGAIGGWAGTDDESFDRALDGALNAPPSVVARIREDLLSRYSWQRCVDATLGIYREVLEDNEA